MKENISRREFIKIGVKVAAGIFVVTACGKLFALGTDRKQKIQELAVDKSNFLIDVEELKKQEAVNFTYEGKKAILLYNEGRIRAFENICTHKGGPSKLNNGRLVCQWHGATFDPLTGQAIDGPAPSGSKLKAIVVKEIEGKIYTG